MSRLDTDSEDRREFLKSCGRFAAVSLPVMTFVAFHRSELGDRCRFERSIRAE